MKYRSDIDGLRALAVLSVIIFHSGLSFLSGGYIGVDVFFVISGYLITTLIYTEVKEKRFSFLLFYKRRAARLLPALAITLLLVFLFGFIFYNNTNFDNLGKELFFSSVGAANILFAQGINYFAKNEAYQPLIHLWSLGVEEQFYIIWPIVLLFAFRFSSQVVLLTALMFFGISLWFSVTAVNQELTEGYFLLQYRAFELLVGVITALYLEDIYKDRLANGVKQLFSFIGLLLVVVPMFVLDKNSNFPGFNALLPTVGAALVIAFPSTGLITKVLSCKVLVFIGLISYPLYLYHQPIISFITFFEVKLSAIAMFFWVITTSVVFSWLTYKYIEVPIRKLAHSNDRGNSHLSMFALVATIPFFAILGFGVAKSEGFEERFRVFNPFALEVSKAHKLSFHLNFERGYQVTSGSHGKVLFLGDSVLQQYVTPISSMLNFKKDQIDTVSRGGCVLLKGIEFKDIFSDISCNNLRDKIYKSKKTYDYIFISQAWGVPNTLVTNFNKNDGELERWIPFLDSTIKHFSSLSKNVVIIGAHPSVAGTLKLQPSIMIRPDVFITALNELKVTNKQYLKDSLTFFQRYKKKSSIQIINPYEIFCKDNKCVTSDGKWSYFSDDQHISVASTEFVIKRLKSSLLK